MSFFAPTFALAGSILVAFLGATLLETRRQKSIRETEKDALREALYSEIIWKLKEIGLSSKYGDLSLADDRLKLERAPSSFQTWPVYDSAVSQPLIFYQIDEARGIELFYRTIRQLPTTWNSIFKSIEALMKNPELAGTDWEREFIGDFVRIILQHPATPDELIKMWGPVVDDPGLLAKTAQFVR